MELPKEFVGRMKEQLDEEFKDFLASYERPVERAIRVNGLKLSVEDFKKISPFELEEVEWEKSGFYVKEEKTGKTVEYAQGLYYPQEPSAMSVVPQLEIKGGERVLDLCAAPGGKSTQIASYMQGNGLLVSNEIDYSRAKILIQNIERAGVCNAVVTNSAPENLAPVFENFFDKILVDAPCSGEGMFKKEENAIPEWSLENVKRCAERQRGILNCADKMLAIGGRIVYSTCTFAPEEDEEQIAEFLKAHTEYRKVSEGKLYPHKIRGEGHYFAALEKTEGERAELKRAEFTSEKELKIFREWERATLKIKMENLRVDGGKIFAQNPDCPDIMWLRRQKISFMPFNNLLGEISFDGKRFEPSHTLAMRLTADTANCIEVDKDRALSYLRGLTFECEKSNGWYLLTHNNYPLGWVKVANGIAKNHYPKGLRI